MSSTEPYLQFRQISKSFPGVRALQDVEFGVRAGSVHALIGENGAGKSTLLKILSGAYSPTAGNLVIDGRETAFSAAADALSAGVAVIYQELHLVPHMSVAENIYLGHLPAHLGVVDRRRLHEMARAQLALVGEDIDPDTKLGRLPIAQRQMVEIAKALTRGAKIIAFDEPTSSLSDREVRKLFQIIGELKRRGHVVLYVSHRMEEIFEICDAVTVLRDGKHVQTFHDMAGVQPAQLIKLMVGRDITDIYNYRPRPTGEVALRVRDVMGRGLTAPASFEVRRGEIVGFFGLVGAGRTELFRLVYGAVPRVAGEVNVLGRSVTRQHPKHAIAAGVVLCPEDRKDQGIFPMRSVLENINVSARRRFSTMGFWIDHGWERRNAQQHVKRLGIRTPNLTQPIMFLSGGNQQKAILARWLSEDVKVVLLDEPTRGIDVGAKSEIYSIVYELASSGVAVAVISSDLPEVMGICDRILVMQQGTIVADVSRKDATQERLLALALPDVDVVEQVNS